MAPEVLVQRAGLCRGLGALGWWAYRCWVGGMPGAVRVRTVGLARGLAAFRRWEGMVRANAGHYGMGLPSSHPVFALVKEQLLPLEPVEGTAVTRVRRKVRRPRREAGFAKRTSSEEWHQRAHPQAAEESFAPMASPFTFAFGTCAGAVPAPVSTPAPTPVVGGMGDAGVRVGAGGNGRVEEDTPRGVVGVEPRARRALFPELSPRVVTDEQVRARGASCPSPPPALDLAGEALNVAGADSWDLDGELAWAREVLRWTVRVLVLGVSVGAVGALLILVYAGWLRLLGCVFGASVEGGVAGGAPQAMAVAPLKSGSSWAMGSMTAVVMVVVGVAWSLMGSGGAALRVEEEGCGLAQGPRERVPGGARCPLDPHAVASATADAPRRGLLRLLDVAQERARAGFGRGIFRCLGDAHASDRSRSAAGRVFVRRRVRRPT